MSDIMKSKAFDEFLQKRCEEITSRSEQIKNIDFLITETENKLKGTFSKTQLDLFLQYEKFCSDYQIVAEKTIYKQCLRDRRL
jgi:nitrogen fixation/metabolism regulation signal transduction histidine kinase